jgi:hypothetical protein
LRAVSVVEHRREGSWVSPPSSPRRSDCERQLSTLMRS